MIVLRTNYYSADNGWKRAAITSFAIGAGIGGLVGLRKGSSKGVLFGMAKGAAIGLGATPVLFGLSGRSGNTPTSTTKKEYHSKVWEELKKKWDILRKVELLSEAVKNVAPDWGDGDEYFYFYLADPFDIEEQIEREEEWIDLIRFPQQGYILFNVNTGKFKFPYYNKKELSVPGLKAHLIQMAQDDIRYFEKDLKTNFDEYDQKNFREAIESDKKIIDLVKRLL